MNPLRARRTGLLAAGALILLFLALTLAVQRSLAQNIPGIDFFVSWQAGRSLLFDRQNPYSPEVHQIIQEGIFGSQPPPAGTDPMRFAYPPFVILPIAPLLSLRFDWAISAWFSLNLLILMICTRYALPKIPLWMLVILPLSYPFAIGLALGNFSVLVFAILIACLGSQLTHKNPSSLVQICLGAGLAWTLAKPQISWFFVAFLILYALLLKRKAFLIAWAGGLAGMVGFSFAVLPDWPALWMKGMQDYQTGLPLQFPILDYLNLIFPPAWNFVLLPVSILAFAAASIWIGLRWFRGRSISEIVACAAWGASLLFLFNPTGRSYDQAIFFAPLLVWAGNPPLRSNLSRFILPGFMLLTWLLFVLSQGAWPLAADRGTFLLFLLCAGLSLYDLAPKPRATRG